MAEKTIHVRIEGRVQGVWFRAWTMQEARERALSGWVRNCSGGSVEALFSGAPDAVDAMVEACWSGPPAARVDNVATSPANPPDDAGFQGLPTK
mgnify:CR=1 FL=1